MCCYPIKIPVRLRNLHVIEMYVPCGECIECARAKSTEWALRISLEAQLYDKNCCITLTYDPEHLPDKGLLKPRDLQLFMKSLRKAIAPQKVRFFASGEYGDKGGRPHYHVILFGYEPPDKQYKFTRNNRPFFTSKTIADIWKRGQILVGEVDWHTAFYTAKYLQKQLFKDKEVRPFVRMSNRPGIGYDAIDPVWLRSGKCYFNGKSYTIPRYFLKVFERDGVVLDDYVMKRAVASVKATDRVSRDQMAYRRRKSGDIRPHYDYDPLHKLDKLERLLSKPVKPIKKGDTLEHDFGEYADELELRRKLIEYGFVEVSPDEFVEADAVKVGELNAKVDTW